MAIKVIIPFKSHNIEVEEREIMANSLKNI